MTPTEKFIQRAKAVHGSKYDYSLASYKGAKTKVEIRCVTHGSFWQTPDRHVNTGNGCQACAGLRRLTNTEFESRAKKVHGDRYDYTKVNYINTSTKVDIVCPDHGMFQQRPTEHLHSMNGCPRCSQHGFDTTLQGTFYIWQCNNLVKVGITNRDVLVRLNEVRKLSQMSFQIRFTVQAEGLKVKELESKALSFLRLHFAPAATTFDGSTECFVDADVDALLKEIQT